MELLVEWGAEMIGKRRLEFRVSELTSRGGRAGASNLLGFNRPHRVRFVNCRDETGR